MNDLIRFSGQESSSGTVGGGAGSGGREETQVIELANGEDLIRELEAVVDRLKTVYNKQSSSLNDNTIEVARFCRSLEAILRHGQKEKVTFWGEKKDYYHYLTENVDSLKSLDQVIKKVQVLTELVSGQGKGRALIRLCLSDQLLADCVQNSLSKSKKTKDWYTPSSILLTPPLAQRLISALYDLSDVTFDLPVDGLDLDETWPSFVQKSFSKSSPDHQSQKSNSSMSGILKALKMRDAKSIDKGTTQEYKLERAIEEEPSEIFAKQEIPFDLALVSSLLEEIRTLLVDEFEGYNHLSNLPTLKVKQLDDITSGLSLLKDYVSTMSNDVTKNNDKRKRLIHQLKNQVAEMETKLKMESEKQEKLQEELESKEDELVSSSLQLQVIKEEKNKLWSQVLEQREEISGLQTLTTQLRKENSKLQPTTNQSYQPQIAQLEQDLANTHHSLAAITSANSHLLLQVAQECELKSILAKSVSLLEERQVKEDSERKSQLEVLQQEIEAVKVEKNEREEELNQLHTQLDKLKLSHTNEIESLREELASTLGDHYETEKERDMIREEVKSMHGLVEQETASLRFQLSTANIQLQQTNEASIKKDSLLVELKEQVQQLSDQVTHARGALYQKEELNQELQQQLAIANTRSRELQEEVRSLNEQLTEKTLNRDAVREESLRLQRDWDDQRERMTRDGQRLNNQVRKLSEENDYLRKVLQKLLQQKVNLWQHADELEQEQVAKGIWLDSRDITDCMGCKTLFTIFNRKHHCRSCGKVYCTTCCSHKAQLPSNKDPVRVCESCYNRIQSLRTPQASSLVNTLIEESTAPIESSSSDLDVPLPSREGMSTSINPFPGGVPLSDSSLLHLSPLDGSDESLLQHLKELTRPKKEPSQRSSFENSIEYSVEPLHNARLDLDPTTTYTLTSTDNTTVDPDDDFCVIDTMPKGEAGDSRLDVHALRTKLASLESSTVNGLEEETGDYRKGSNQVSPTSSDMQEVSDMEVEGGSVHSVLVLVETPRTVVSWQFSSQPKGIAVGLKYQEREDEISMEVLPLRRVMSHKTVLTGEYVAQKAGVYTLVFSNAHSKFSGRLLSYKVWKKLP